MGAEPEKITAAYPNVLAVTGPQQYESVLDAVHRAAPPQPQSHVDLIPPQGIKLTPRHYAYLKISEGCNNRCTFCIIPKRRGGLASPQDTSAYGTDVKYAASEWKGRPVRAKFIDLARELGELGVWVRLHYVYPYPHVDEVIALMADGKVLPYLDVPFQHAGGRPARGSPSARPSSSGSRARPRRIFPCCSTGSAKRNSIVSAASATSRPPAPQQTISEHRFPNPSRRSATIA
jgi:tRNA A37 methylthiotransferase MiaB